MEVIKEAIDLNVTPIKENLRTKVESKILNFRTMKSKEKEKETKKIMKKPKILESKIKRRGTIGLKRPTLKEQTSVNHNKIPTALRK